MSINENLIKDIKELFSFKNTSLLISTDTDVKDLINKYSSSDLMDTSKFMNSLPTYSSVFKLDRETSNVEAFKIEKLKK